MIQSAAERTVNLLREAHVTVYTIDPTLSTKLVAEIDDTATASDSAAFAAETHNPTDPFDGTVSFNTIAPLTGGRAFSMFNDIDQEIATSVTQGSAYYSLAYVPYAAIDPDHTFRGIDVKVARPGVTVVTRHGYYSVTPLPPATTPRQELKSEAMTSAPPSEAGSRSQALLLVPDCRRPNRVNVWSRSQRTISSGTRSLMGARALT